jgi:hypothetical protein
MYSNQLEMPSMRIPFYGMWWINIKGHGGRVPASMSF